MQKQNLTQAEVETTATNLIKEICTHNDWQIRRCFEEMFAKVEEVDEETAACHHFSATLR